MNSISNEYSTHDNELNRQRYFEFFLKLFVKESIDKINDQNRNN